MDWVPRSLRRQARRINDASHELAGELGRCPTVSELASKLGANHEDFQRSVDELQNLQLESLQSQAEGGTGENLLLASRLEEDPFQTTCHAEIHHLLDMALSGLGKKEGEVLRLYYLEELTMTEIGALLGICESRVSQIRVAALTHLRARLIFQPPCQRIVSTTVWKVTNILPTGRYYTSSPL